MVSGKWKGWHRKVVYVHKEFRVNKRKKNGTRPLYLVTSYTRYFFFAAFFLAGRLFPKEPLNLFPLAVFLSPLPIVFVFDIKVIE
jgi:hypothetical protein